MAIWPTRPQPQMAIVSPGWMLQKVCGHVAGRKDIRQEQNLFIGQPLRHLKWPDIGIGHAEIFRLSTRVSAEKMGVTEQAGRRMAPQFLGLFRALAAGEKAALAKEAFAAGDGEGHDHPVANLQCLVLPADFAHFAPTLMARMSPLSMPGMTPSKICRSEPQIAQAVTLMIASRGCSILGSGTVSHRISPLPL
jgi:hypothetical protein